MNRPHVTALGGGTGLSSLLRGLKRRVMDISAVVSCSSTASPTATSRATPSATSSSPRSPR